MASPSLPPFQPFFPGDRATAPMGIEETSDSAWQRFQAAQEAHDLPFAPTEPAQAPTSARAFMATQPLDRAPVLPTRPAPRALSLDQVMVLARRNNRACPLAPAWARLVELLPMDEQKGSPVAPPPPIDGAAWSAVSPMQKRLRLRDQIEWAERTGALPAVHDFLSALPEEQWLHMAD